MKQNTTIQIIIYQQLPNTDKTFCGASQAFAIKRTSMLLTHLTLPRLRDRMKRDVDLLSDELVPFVDDAPRRDADGDDATT